MPFPHRTGINKGILIVRELTSKKENIASKEEERKMKTNTDVWPWDKVHPMEIWKASSWFGGGQEDKLVFNMLSLKWQQTTHAYVKLTFGHLRQVQKRGESCRLVLGNILEVIIEAIKKNRVSKGEWTKWHGKMSNLMG